MICYMPYTSLDNDQMQALFKLFGAFAVYAPAESLLPDHMRLWGEKGELDIRYPVSVNAAQLIAAIEDYNAWAELHQGSIGDMALFLKTEQGRIPMMEETNPTQIGHQIRHYGESTKMEGDDLLFKACLFLSMAQAYDAQQRGMERELDAVSAMEQQMLRQLSGDDQTPALDVRTAKIPVPSSEHHSQGPYMTSQRVQAWSRLALDNEELPLVFATLDKDVVEHVLDIFTDAEAILTHTMPVSGDHPMLSSSRLRRTIQEAASIPDWKCFESAPDDHLPSHGSATALTRLTLYKLVGISPDCFLRRLAAYKYEQGAVAQDHHAIIGWVTA